MAKNIEKLEDLKQDDKNANRGTKRGLDLLEKSLEKFGVGRGVLVDKNGKLIAGNKTVAAAIEKGFGVKVVRTDGKTLVVTQRSDLDMDTDIAARELGIADNRVAEIDLDWDEEALLSLKEAGIDLSEWWLEDEEAKLLQKHLADSEGETPVIAPTDMKCPSCGYEWSSDGTKKKAGHEAKPNSDDEGFE